METFKSEINRKLESHFSSNKSSFLVLNGPIGVGKSELIDGTFKRKYFFQLAGNSVETTAELFQLVETKLQKRLRRKWEIHTWKDAFDALLEVLKTSKSDEKKVIYISQAALFDTHKSKFFQSLIDFWNTIALNRKDVLIILSSDSKAWTQNKLVANKKLLESKSFESIDLKPMTLIECEQFLLQKKIRFTRSEILDFYRVFGGIRSQWNKLVANKSMVKQLNDLCFKDKTFANKLQKELIILFKQNELHYNLIASLSSHIEGLNRYEWLSKAKLSNGGGASRAIEDLIQNRIVSKKSFYGRANRDSLYYLSDYSVLFQLVFLNAKKKYTWTSLQKHPMYLAWQNQAFKTVCIDHLQEIKAVLGISGLQTEESYWVKKNKKVSRSIDFILSRKDNVIHLFQFQLNANVLKNTTDDFSKTMKSFQSILKTKKQCIETVLCAIPSKEQIEVKHQKVELTLDDLFVQPIRKNKGYNFL